MTGDPIQKSSMRKFQMDDSALGLGNSEDWSKQKTERAKSPEKEGKKKKDRFSYIYIHEKFAARYLTMKMVVKIQKNISRYKEN